MQDKTLDKQIEVLKHIDEKLADIIEYLAKAEQPNLFIQLDETAGLLDDSDCTPHMEARVLDLFACLKADVGRDLASIREIRKAVNNSI